MMRARRPNLKNARVTGGYRRRMPAVVRWRRGLVLLPCLLLVAAFHPLDGWAADREAALERWRSHDPASPLGVDHRHWESFLLNYLRPGRDGVHRLTYGQVKARDRRKLNRYIEKMGNVDIVAYRRSEQLAYWINLYNALMVKFVLDHYPFATIRKIGDLGDGQTANAWDSKLIVIDSIALSLHDIEQDILDPIWSDPRIHYAITCPAIGCPNLQPIPYDGQQLEWQLNEAAAAFVNDPRRVNIQDDKLYVSSFYRWRMEAFGGNDRGVINHLMAYAKPELAMALQNFDHMHGEIFDWRLNDSAD